MALARRRLDRLAGPFRDGRGKTSGRSLGPFHPLGLVAKINDLSREHNMIELYKIMIWHFIYLCQV